ncbi:MAG: protein translocase subunit SecD [Planctomycetaceae bacterium]
MIQLPIDGLLFAQATQTKVEVAQKAGEAAETGTSGWVLLLVIIGVFVLPFVAGWLISRMLKLKDLSFRIGLVLFTATLGLTPFAWKVANGQSWKDAIRLGIDLAGGANLVFKVDAAKAEEQGKPITNELMGRMIGAVARRLDPAAQEQITVRQVGMDRIEIIIPGADREVVEQKKKLVHRLGSLEFAILANTREQSHRAIIAEAMKRPDKNVRMGDRIVASWREAAWETKPDGTLVQKDIGEGGDVVTRPVQRDGKEIKEFLVIVEQANRQVTGQFLTRAYQTMDEATPAVGFQFNSEGARRFMDLTGRYMPKSDGFESRLAILLDEYVQSAPNLQARISDSGVIRGRFTQQEIDDLINILNAGALAVPIIPDPVLDLTISPTLGTDVQEKGLNAILISSIAVVIFMLIYYRFAGLVADISLILNMILLMGIMAIIDASFTLPGLAGIALTIGMAVDANVLVFERMREELNRGSSLRMAIHNGFHKALPAIVDSNVTTLITAAILFMIGTDQVKGFAVSLFIGILVSLFSALFLGRLLLEIAERKRWVKTLTMMNFVGETHFDFVGKRKAAFVLSTLIIGGGLIAFFYRGTDNLDVDLSGGTMVTFQFNEPQPIEDVRKELQANMGAISLEQLTLIGETQTKDTGKRFRVRTKEQDIAKVREQVNDSLKGRPLHRVTVELGQLQPIAAASEPPKADEKTATAAPSEADKFAGGRQAELTFSDDIAMGTVVDYLGTELRAIKGTGDASRYELPETLFEVVPVGQTSGAGSLQIFRKATVKVSPQVAEEDLSKALAGMKTTMATYPIFDEVNSFASSVAVEMQESAILALLASMVAIVAYLWFRFTHVTFGLATISAVVHDLLLVLGMIAIGAYLSRTPIAPLLGLEDFKINMEVVAALMTIAGYSLNDTIVVFDRLREIRGKNPALTAEMVNVSLNQTLARTILTSLTVFLVVIILYVLGGEGIHGFAYCLFVGMVTGVYSTIYIAAPVLLWLMNRPGSEVAKATAAMTQKTAVAR